MKRSLSNSVVSLIIILIAGCGFHLRGTADLADGLKTMYIQGINTRQDLGREIKRTLETNGVNVLAKYQANSAVLTIIDNKVERRVLSVGTDAKANEFELYGSVTFKVMDESGVIVIDNQTVQAQRDYQFDQDQVLGSENEESSLRVQLNKQLAQAIMRRLSVLK